MDDNVILNLKERLERLERLIAAALVPHGPQDNRTHLERVTDVLARNSHQHLTATEIARAAGIEISAARLVLYTNKEKFVPTRISPGRVRWQLNQDAASGIRVSETETAKAGALAVCSA